MAAPFESMIAMRLRLIAVHRFCRSPEQLAQGFVLGVGPARNGRCLALGRPPQGNERVDPEADRQHQLHGGSDQDDGQEMTHMGEGV